MLRNKVEAIFIFSIPLFIFTDPLDVTKIVIVLNSLLIADYCFAVKIGNLGIVVDARPLLCGQNVLFTAFGEGFAIATHCQRQARNTIRKVTHSMISSRNLTINLIALFDSLHSGPVSQDDCLS